jgi:hypothetical protein
VLHFFIEEKLLSRMFLRQSGQRISQEARASTGDRIFWTWKATFLSRLRTEWKRQISRFAYMREVAEF